MWKSKRLKNLRDDMTFRLSSRLGSTEYTLHSKERGRAVYTSNESGRTFTGSLNKLVLIYESKFVRG